MDRRRFLGAFVAVLGGLFMPTSNGQVASRDIRQGAVKTLHILDEAVTTPKIPDLAVTFPDKIDDPVWVFGVESEGFHNITINTGFYSTLCDSLTIAIPAWVDQVVLYVTATVQFTNGSGSDQEMAVAGFVNGDRIGHGRTVTAKTADINATSEHSVFNLAGVAGSSVLVELYAGTGGGSSSTSNNGSLCVMAIGHR